MKAQKYVNIILATIGPKPHRVYKLLLIMRKCVGLCLDAS